MLLEVMIFVTLGEAGSDRKGRECFWVAGNVLVLDISAVGTMNFAHTK